MIPTLKLYQIKTSNTKDYPFIKSSLALEKYEEQFYRTGVMQALVVRCATPALREAGAAAGQYYLIKINYIARNLLDMANGIFFFPERGSLIFATTAKSSTWVL